MKRALSLFLSMAMLLVMTACSQPATPTGTVPGTQPSETHLHTTHTPTESTTSPTIATESSHEYSNTNTKEPTCAADGEMTYTCNKCGNSYTDSILTQVAHSFADATYSEVKKCTVCGATEGTALDHDYAEGTCTRCGKNDPDYNTLTNGVWFDLKKGEYEEGAIGILNRIIFHNDGTWESMFCYLFAKEDTEGIGMYLDIKVNDETYTYIWVPGTGFNSFARGTYSVEGNIITVSYDEEGRYYDSEKDAYCDYHVQLEMVDSGTIRVLQDDFQPEFEYETHDIGEIDTLTWTNSYSQEK